MLVVNPNHRLKTWLAAVEPPLWAGLIASYMDADILDAEAEDLTLEQTEEAIRHHMLTQQYPDKDVIIVVMGNSPSVSSTPKMPIAEALAGKLSDLRVCLTGLHPSAILRSLHKTQYFVNSYLLVEKPFQGFPMMPWDKLPMDKYRAHNWHCLDGSPRSPYASIYTSLGCPFNCYYCNIHTLYGDRQVRFRPIDDVLKEVDILATRYGVRNIKIWDELFMLDHERVVQIADGLESYDLNIWAYARLDTVTEKTLKAMKDAGFNWLAYGFESVRDPKFIKDTKRVIAMTRNAGINIIANFMFGLPGTMPEDDQAGVDFAKKHLFEFVNFYDAKPYPGSRWYDEVKPQLLLTDFSQYSNRSEFRKQAFKDYFSNPAYLEMISQKFGEQGKQQIEEMLAWRI